MILQLAWAGEARCRSWFRLKNAATCDAMPYRSTLRYRYEGLGTNLSMSARVVRD